MSSINSIQGVTGDSYYSQSTSTKSVAEATKDTAKGGKDAAAVYESDGKADNTKKTYRQDRATIDRLLQETEQRRRQLQDLVARTLGKQGDVFNASIFGQLKNGTLLSPEDIAQAKKDVSVDGYWGVEQTSERLYSFAYALTGGDPSKADEMMEAIEKGFQQATGAWGGELPDISKQTLEATREKINEWKNTSELEQ